MSARATRSRSAEHFRPRDPVSPVTFLASCALWMGEENSAWRGVTRDFAHILHGEQEFAFRGPPPAAGTELIGLQSIDRTYAKTGARGRYRQARARAPSQPCPSPVPQSPCRVLSSAEKRPDSR